MSRGKNGSVTFLELGLESPDTSGASEHRAIYDLLVDAFDTGDDAFEDMIGDDPTEYARTMLEEVISWAQEMTRQINIRERDTKRAAERAAMPDDVRRAVFGEGN